MPSEHTVAAERSLISELPGLVNNNVFIKASVYNARLLGKLAFLVVRDRTGMVQVVVGDAEQAKKFGNLNTGSIVYISGKIVATDKTDLKVEIVDPEITLVNEVKENWAVDISKPDLNVNLDTLLEHRAVSLRHPKQQAIFKVQTTLVSAYREYMQKHGFTEYFPPLMLASSSEGGTEIFTVNYFDKKATLAQSSQLYKQMMVGVYERVFGLVKCFRAENSNTRRHLTEATQFEFEMGYINSIHDVMDHLDAALKHMIAAVKIERAAELKTLDAKLVIMPEGKFPRITFAEAAQIIHERTGEDTSKWDDLTTESERELCAYSREKYGSDFIFVMHYPKGKFYAFKDEEGKYHNFDLICREAEIVSGGRRIDNYEKLVAAIEKEGMNPESFSEYLSIFKYGMPPHGGFGLGMERLTTLVLGLDNIREGTLFPSDTKRIASQSIPDSKLYGSDAIKKEIKKLFVEADVPFQILQHEPTVTSEDSAKVRGLQAATGAKALILRDKSSNKNYMAVVPADKKLDIKKLQEHIAATDPKVKLEMEKPETIKENYGLEVGGVPPFGTLIGIKTFVDAKVFDAEVAGFNIADKSESLLCTGKDLQKVLRGETVAIVAE